MKIVQCQDCGCTVEAERATMKRCNNCKRLVQRQSNRRYAERKQLAKPRTGICGNCGDEFVRNTGKSRPQTYCSRKCAGQHLHLSNQVKAGIVRADHPCAQCGETIPASARTDTLYCSARCREVFNYQKSGPTQRLALWGLTQTDYDDMLAAQGGSCAVDGCDVSMNSNGRRLHVDHDHSCCPGRYSCGACIRGLLCGQHNVGIGMFNDDPAALRAAAAYIESF